MGNTHIASCINCKDRHINCHSTCERYIKDKIEWEQRKEQIKKARQQNQCTMTAGLLKHIHKQR